MADLNSTSITDLPTDPSSGGTDVNVRMTISEQPQMSMDLGHSQGPVAADSGAKGFTLDESTISQIVSGIQQASMSGATQLPSRDIPMTTGQLTQDAQVQPNYVPPPSHRDYINENDDDIKNYYRAERTQNSLDAMYDEVQTPILLAILYFIFQLPVFKRTLSRYLPFLCHNDGNYNINGFLFTCALYGFVYYAIMKALKQFSSAF